jgi:hypothetical protein
MSPEPVAIPRKECSMQYDNPNSTKNNDCNLHRVSAQKPIEIVSELTGVLTRVFFILIEDSYVST